MRFPDSTACVKNPPMSASRVEESQRSKARRKPTRQAAPVSDPVADVARIPASAIRLRLNYADPLDYKPRTTDLSQLRMEFDDSQVLRYLYRNHAPKRHLEFGTWEGQGALCCLEESQATVWSLNRPDGEIGSDGKFEYHRLYDVEVGAATAGRYVRGGDPVAPGTERRAYQTDAGAFIGHLVR